MMFNKPYIVVSSSTGIVRDDHNRVIRFATEQAAAELAADLADCLPRNSATEYHVVLNGREIATVGKERLGDVSRDSVRGDGIKVA